MFSFFKKKYQTRHDGKSWTKNQILQMILREWAQLNPVLEGNTIWLDDHHLGIDFISSNYSNKNDFELNGSIFFLQDGVTKNWEDLFSYAKSVYGETYRALHIYRDEEWNGSKVQKECKEAFLPLIAVLMDKEKRAALLAGKEVFYKGQKVAQPYTELAVLRKNLA